MGKFTNLWKMKFSTDIFSSAMVKRSKFQLFRTTMLLAQLRMVASNHLFEKCYQTLRQVENQIIIDQALEEILKLLGL